MSAEDNKKYLNPKCFALETNRSQEKRSTYYFGDPDPAVVERVTDVLKAALPGLDVTPISRNRQEATYEGTYNITYSILSEADGKKIIDSLNTEVNATDPRQFIKGWLASEGYNPVPGRWPPSGEQLLRVQLNAVNHAINTVAKRMGLEILNCTGPNSCNRTTSHGSDSLQLFPYVAENPDFVAALKTDENVQAALKPIRERLPLARIGITQKPGGRVMGEKTD